MRRRLTNVEGRCEDVAPPRRRAQDQWVGVHQMRTVDESWKAREDDFLYDAPRRDQLRYLLNFAVLAPSIYNTQPWFFRIAGDALEVYADRTRLLRRFDPSGRELVLSCGASLMYLRVAMRRFGFDPVVKTFPQMDVPNLLASVRLGPAYEPDAEDVVLFESIRRRRPRPDVHLDAPGLSQRLADAVQQEGALMDIVQGQDRETLSELVEEGIRLQTVDPELRKELATWMPIVTGSGTGSAENPERLSGDGLIAHGARLVHNVNWGEGKKSDSRATPTSEPLLAVVSTRSENPFEWLAAGQALGRMLLVARDLDLHVSFLNQPVEVEALRHRLRELVGPERVPQIVLRLAQGDQGAPVPRRPLHDVLSAF